ncbi:MAG: hypothetical protein WDN28_24295 [Chthoniobacter sp.]
MPPAIIRLLDDLRVQVPNAYVRLETFDQGGTSVDVSIGSRAFELFCGPLSGYGVSENTEETLPFTQHDRYFPTPEEATSHLLTLVKEAARQTTPHAA